MPATRSQLTYREREVLCLLPAGQNDRKIAESLTISPRTVNRHMSNIFAKLEVPSRAAAAADAVRYTLQRRFYRRDASANGSRSATQHLL